MTKTEKALSAGLVVAVVALGLTLLESSVRVIVIKDGTVDFFPIDSNITPKHPPQGQGKKYVWSARARSVAVWRCGEASPEPGQFQRVLLTVSKADETELELQFQNEGNKLAVSFGDGYAIEWSGAGHRFQTDSGEFQDFRIQSVKVDNGTPSQFNGDGCIAFHERERDARKGE